MLRSLVASFALLMSAALSAQAPNYTPYRKPMVTSTWEFRQAHTGDWKPVKHFPISVHTALLENGMIEDPYYRDNEEKVQWIERADWEFQTNFQVDDVVLQRKHIELVFKGLDTYAHVYLNDSLLLETDNQFRTWRADAKALLKPGNNHLHVYFESPLVKTDNDWKALGYELPGGQRTMTRKGQFHYGWDWGPRLVGAGILQRPEIEAWDDFRFQNVFFTTTELTPEKARVVARFRYQSDVAMDVSAVIKLPRGKSLEDRKIMPGVHEDSVWFDLKDPKLWWSAGLGEPFLYDLGLEIKHNSRTIERQDVRVGIRKIELVTEKDEAGETFYFRLNGKPVFARGANYIPQDLFQDRVTSEHYQKLIDDVVASNMNMLRVWGGGIYEDDQFYRLCDEKGILVWQDFMYACAMYPGNGQFLKNAAAEAFEQIERLRQHPSIALWCGNNENDEAWHNWGWQMKFNEAQRARLWRDYQTLFRDVLGTYVKNYAGGVPYWESSPRYGRYNPKSLTEGDNHYWGVWHDEEPFSVFDKKVPRFMSEYGFQSFPDWRTVESFTLPEDRKIDSKVMLLHQKHPRGNALIAEYTRREYRVPKSFQDFVYVSQLVQADGMRAAIEAHRRNKPYCMGTLYWQLNDVWPVASWSGRDNVGRWKALQYTVREAFKPVVVLPFLAEKDTFKVFAVNDLAAVATASLRVRVLTFEGKTVSETTVSNQSIPTDSSVVLWQIPLKTLLAKNRPNEVVVELVLSAPDSTVLSRRLWYAEPPKELKLSRKADVDLKGRAVDGGYEIILHADRLVKNVWLQTNVEGFFSDNYFDLLPDETRTVLFKTKTTVTDKDFRTRSLGETGE